MPENPNRVAILERLSSVRSWPALWLFVAVICFTALADSLATPALIDFDSHLAASIGAWRGKGLDQWMLFLTAFGGWYMTLIALAATIGLWTTHHRREAGMVVLATAGAMLLNVLLKFAIDRPRPDATLIHLISGTRFASFPSGHTMGAVATLGSMLLVAQRLGVPVWALWLGWLMSGLVTAGIGLSRIYLGAHFASDVLGGLLASAAWLVIAGSLERSLQTQAG